MSMIQSAVVGIEDNGYAWPYAAGSCDRGAFLATLYAMRHKGAWLPRREGVALALAQAAAIFATSSIRRVPAPTTVAAR